MKNIRLLLRLEMLYPDNKNLTRLRKIIIENDRDSAHELYDFLQPNFLTAWIKKMDELGIEWDEDSVSQGQLNSKLWLIHELKKLDLDFGSVCLCAGWYGILARLMLDHGLNIEKIRSFDIDSKVKKISEILNQEYMNNGKFHSITDDIYHIDFRGYSYEIHENNKTIPQHDVFDTIINTSCEHLRYFSEWYAKIPLGKITIMQTNNFHEISDHVNTVQNLDEFADQTPMNEILYSGELPTEKYTRFMRIGIR